MYEITIIPRYSETDALGHINNTVLPVWFEASRNDLFALLNPAMTHHDWPLILAKIGSKSFTVKQQAIQSGDVVAEGHAIMVWFDHQTQSSNPLPESALAVLETHLIQPDNE